MGAFILNPLLFYAWSRYKNANRHNKNVNQAVDSLILCHLPSVQSSVWSCNVFDPAKHPKFLPSSNHCSGCWTVIEHDVPLISHWVDIFQESQPHPLRPRIAVPSHCRRSALWLRRCQDVSGSGKILPWKTTIQPNIEGFLWHIEGKLPQESRHLEESRRFLLSWIMWWFPEMVVSIGIPILWMA